MIDMPQVQMIRAKYREGNTVTEIASELGVSRPTVRKYIGMDDFNKPVPKVSARPSKLDPYKSQVVEWLEQDKKVWYKQRHTAKRIFDRLREETDYEGGYDIVRRFIKSIKVASGQQGVLDLVWAPGEIQVDFGEADFCLLGTIVRMHYLVVCFPYSNVAFTQVFRGENAECVCEGLKRIFDYVGGVPVRAVFDNGAGIGKKVYDKIRLTELFGLFKLHYRFEVTLCNTGVGREKGSVENAVGTIRRNMFVPIPDVSDIDRYNRILLDECLDRADVSHYRKGENSLTLFDSDRLALSPLPAKPFDCVRYQSFRTDGYGNVVIDNRHRYSTTSSLAGQNVTVAFGAEDIRIYDLSGAFVAEHTRLYSETPSESIDPGASLRLLARRPGAWMNSKLRMSLPESLVNYIDAQEKDIVRDCIKTLADVTDQTDFLTAVNAAWNVYRRSGQLKHADVSVYAMSMFSSCCIEYDDVVDLDIYDQAFEGMEVLF